MSQNNLCPECGKILYEKIKRCGCGWSKPELKSHLQSDFRCQYQAMGKRCRLPGTICSHPYGTDSWYCTSHYRTRNDPHLGEAVLRENEKNYHQIMENRLDWRRKLFH